MTHVEAHCRTRVRIETLSICAALCLGVALSSTANGQGRATGRVVAPSTHGHAVERDVSVDARIPEWLAAPTRGQLVTAPGTKLVALQNASVSFENATLGIMVGALRNDGECLSDAEVSYQYVDAAGMPLGPPIMNEARVTTVTRGGLLPFRFRLRHRSELPVEPSGYVVEVFLSGVPRDAVAGDSPGATQAQSACLSKTQTFDVHVTQPGPSIRSYEISGTLRLLEGLPVRMNGVALTAVILGDRGEVLEVLTGTPEPDEPAGQHQILSLGDTATFTMASPIPLGKWVKEVSVFAEVLPEPSSRVK